MGVYHIWDAYNTHNRMFKYLIRLDDACPTMDRAKWQRMFNLLAKYNVRPMVGIIPLNADPKQQINAIDTLFWNKARFWQAKGYAIALHGYDHCYISNLGKKGLNPLWSRSEFSGIPFESQCKKIRDGYKILKENGLEPKYFFAPSHTFDENTLKALKFCTPIRIISDTIATKPYKMRDFTFIPQLGGHCTEMKIPGIWTFCLHPNTMTEKDFTLTESFLKRHKDEFISFDELDLSNLKGKNVFDRLLSWAYFTRRKFQK